MKVLISRKDLQDTRSGVPRIVLQQLHYFKSLGHEVFVIAETLDKSMIEAQGGIAVKTFKWPVSGYFLRRFYDWQVSRWIAKHQPDLVIGHGDILNQDILYMHNCVHLAHERVEDTALAQQDATGKMHTAILEKGSFKLLICNSQLMKDDLVKRFALDPARAMVLYPAVNFDHFQTQDPEKIRQEWRAKFGFKKNDLVIGLVTSGNFKKRNLGLLIDAFKALLPDYPHIKLFVAGKNIDADYQNQAPRQSTVFAPAIRDVKNYYYLLDIFVLPAHIEEFGLSVLEAMFCKIPVITTKFVGASEIIQGIGRDFILQTLDQKNLVHMIIQLLDKKLACDIANHNYQTALTLNIDQQNALLSQALKAHGLFSRANT
jgi:UDP-glucose:(heptosyl)LPS alpha-1,3-glucosyltransferase